MTHTPKLIVARKALDFVAEAESVANALPRKYARLADQLRRSSIGCALNLSEGGSEIKPDEKKRLYRLARREAAEARMALAIVRRLNIAHPDRLTRVDDLINQIIAMLTALVASPRVGILEGRNGERGQGSE